MEAKEKEAQDRREARAALFKRLPGTDGSNVVGSQVFDDDLQPPGLVPVQSGYGNGGGTGRMSDAARRQRSSDDDWEEVTMGPLESTASIADFMGTNNVVPVPSIPDLGAIDHADVDTSIPMPVQVLTVRNGGSVIIKMEKYRGQGYTFEGFTRSALGGNVEHIRYASYIKERFKRNISSPPASQGPDFCACLHFAKFVPPTL